MLEGILDRSKPALPETAADLHYLLATPFRYASPIGSRFRAPADAGVWYGADAPFGGYKHSGIGREMGVEGFEEYLEIKTIATPA